MLWIIILGFAGFAIVAWARASRRNFEGSNVEREQRAERRRLDAEEEALLAKMRAKKEE